MDFTWSQNTLIVIYSFLGVNASKIITATVVQEVIGT